ncbi:hypothetical protein PLEOSDRAFT_1101316 [Pleurotus ostreatus PC15]|uniref:Uncharacterized protein n=2 Tax=Pleurotus TaxID=5320 RepID=A0A067NQZ5_PLEO1|nr:hypothetical protein CCMSSC00406_0000060 [Pleurotus cornucopiae]KDQ30319.1 hypothetical protein PLEOSDRAFT_1101316 [Pleurotus ostreatus PC15]
MVFLLVLSGLATIAAATPLNVTVDDTFGAYPRVGANITYSDGWFSEGFSNCPQCRPPFRQAMNASWTVSSYFREQQGDQPKTATLKFNGTAVYVNCIVGPSTVTGVIGNVDITFSIDGLVGLNYAEPAPQQYIYRANVFAKTDLSPGEHTLVVQNGRGNGEYDQVMMFLDSIIYTTDDSVLSQAPSNSPPPSDQSGQPQPAATSNGVAQHVVIVAAICAALGGFVLGGLALHFFRRVRRARASATSPRPFDAFKPSPWQDMPSPTPASISTTPAVTACSAATVSPPSSAAAQRSANTDVEQVARQTSSRRSSTDFSGQSVLIVGPAPPAYSN